MPFVIQTYSKLKTPLVFKIIKLKLGLFFSPPFYLWRHPLVLVCLLAPSGGKGENGFNCEAECGLYKKSDLRAPLLHVGCKAMDKSEKCHKKFVEKKRKRSRKKKTGDDTRIVGGEEAKDPMPWMVNPVFSQYFDFGSTPPCTLSRWLCTKVTNYHTDNGANQFQTKFWPL